MGISAVRALCASTSHEALAYLACVQQVNIMSYSQDLAAIAAKLHTFATEGDPSADHAPSDGIEVLLGLFCLG